VSTLELANKRANRSTRSGRALPPTSNTSGNQSPVPPPEPVLRALGSIEDSWPRD